MIEDLPIDIFLLILSFITGDTDTICARCRRCHFNSIVRMPQISKTLNEKVKYLGRTFWDNTSAILDQMIVGKCLEFQFLVNINIYSLLNIITDKHQLLFILENSWPPLSILTLITIIERYNWDTYLLIHEKIINNNNEFFKFMSPMLFEDFVWFLLIKHCIKYNDIIENFLNEYDYDFTRNCTREGRNKFYKTLPMETLVFLSNRGIPMTGKILRKRMKASQPLF